MVAVYSPEGIKEEKDAVDARECVEHCGYTFDPVVADDKPKKTKEAKTDAGTE